MAARTRGRSTSYLVNLFGLENALLQALVLMWVSLFIGLVVLSALGFITANMSMLVVYAVGTLAVTLATAFQAQCMSVGGCNKAALVLIVLGNIALVGSALALH